ncbi:Uncharacterised protein [Mycoplasmopsis edwardii]|nr:Uncharacterised protein [Mycoplasmopsis edwardii]
MYFGSPQDDNGVETLDNVIYKYVNAILQNFYKTLLKLEASIN